MVQKECGIAHMDHQKGAGNGYLNEENALKGYIN